MTISFDPIEMRTSQRLAGVRALVCLLKDLNPAYVERKQAELQRYAMDHGLEAEQYFSEREILDIELEFRLPQIIAFAIATHLHSILEVHLRECAKRAEERMNLPSGPDELKDRGIKRYATYLSRSGVYDAMKHEAWQAATDLRAIRNLIVHRAGTDIKEKDAKRLKREYEKRFAYLEDDTGWWKEVWVSADLCELFADKVEALTKDCLAAVNSATRRVKS
ncbi:MAG: hypothetical protein F4X77_10610 [Acidobacteriia bacterium]|nr:hypothetical protein [Terriglobia bacterium]